MTTPSLARRAGDKDLVFGLATLACAAGYYALAIRIPHSQLADAVGPQGLPKTYACLLAALSIVLIIRSLASRHAASSAADTPREAGARRHVRWRVAGMLTTGVVYIVVVPWLGYLLSLALLIAASTYFQGGGINRRSVLVAVSGALLLWLLFVWLLRIQYPAGIWPSVI